MPWLAPFVDAQNFRIDGVVHSHVSELGTHLFQFFVGLNVTFDLVLLLVQQTEHHLLICQSIYKVRVDVCVQSIGGRRWIFVTDNQVSVP